MRNPQKYKFWQFDMHLRAIASVLFCRHRIICKMLLIPPPADTFTIVATVDGPAPAIAEMESHARLGLQIFPEFQGFVAGALHKSSDQTRLIQYLQWKSVEAYEQCRDDDRWKDLPSTSRFMALASKPGVTVDARQYFVLSSTERNDEIDGAD